MSILLAGGLPEEIDGAPIAADFRNMVQFDMALHDDELDEGEKALVGLRLLYPGFCGETDADGRPWPAPAGAEEAVRGLLWFYCRGESGKKGERSGRGGTARAYDFECDDGLIYAAFTAAYRMNLATVEFLHWWEFTALLEGLPESCLMARVMYWRTADVGRLGKEERKHVLAMRRRFAIEKPHAPPLSAEELARQTKAHVKKRMEEAQRELRRQG